MGFNEKSFGPKSSDIMDFKLKDVPLTIDVIISHNDHDVNNKSASEGLIKAFWHGIGLRQLFLKSFKTR
jgi:hypothetical protein